LRLGDLKGNRFVITIRAISASNEIVEAALNDLQKFGFINYFGLQRFGSSAISTHSIGIALLKSDYEKAAQLMLDPREGEPSEFYQARLYYKETGDIDGAINKFPDQLYIERMFF